MTKGVPIGYKHNWNYTVKRYKSKEGNNKEDFTEVQSKSRNRKTKIYGNLRKGSKIVWKLKGTFKTKKTPNGWKTTYKMKKNKIKIKPYGRRWT